MGNRLVALVEHEFYHVYNRGVDKRVTFLDDADYIRFIELLYLCNTHYAINVREVRKYHSSIFDFDRGPALVAIGAFCLMPNHFHILVTPLVPDGLSIFMKKISNAYTGYFNKRYSRTGALFQNAFRSEHAGHDEYLKYIFSYIHLNPVKLIDPHWKEQGSNNATKSFDFAALYRYSSLTAYSDFQSDWSGILDKSKFPDYFETAGAKQKELFEWLTFTPQHPP